ncbi:flagellar hook-basal body protein [Desulfonatronovibrio hydrogenovorans]|uniref:flagellar hook-basal body protein n=1 Tax=Desulfonatronovibrio hydrogenovorans TaxID=53245 RepID=UPI00048CD70D|nr:flagellar hook-basal body protein [Desulfonatronovibrio hydrogenovorans]
MRDSMYSAFYGAMTQESRMNIISNNLANVNTTGYKREKLAFEDVFVRYASDYADPNESLEDRILWPEAKLRSQTRSSPTHVVFEQGGLKSTGNRLDLAISGEGFFEVETLEGDVAYTRNGAFYRDPETGAMITGQRFQLLGENGPILIPEDAADIVITQDGQVVADGEVIDIINLTTFDNLNGLEKMGRQLFRVKEGTDIQAEPAENALIQQGFLEDSNVEVVYEMVNMISTMRNFEALQKAMTTTHEKDQQLIRDVGTTR